MTRARETANIIHKSLHHLPKTETDFLREGSPFPPEPSEPLHVTHRTPQHEVCVYLNYTIHSYSMQHRIQ